jgi:hypothetical protein
VRARRRNDRSYPLALAVKYRVAAGPWREATTRTISTSSVTIASGGAVRVGAPVALLIALPYAPGVLVGTGRIARAGDSSFAVDIRSLTIGHPR